MNEIQSNIEYRNWLNDLKLKIKRSQIKASLAVNSQLILMYWELGAQIVEKQEKTKWGSGFINQLSNDLKAEFTNIAGFSRSNLFSIKKFYIFYNQNNTIVHQVSGQFENTLVEQSLEQKIKSKIPNICLQIPWKHNVLITEKTTNINEALYYIEQTIANNWSRAVLEYQIETKLFSRNGKAINNFTYTLPEIDSDLANSILKDPYNFDFLMLSSKVKEQELEQKLIQHITQFLLELGKGFAYMGRQFLINVGGKDFKTDLLFYHTRLKCYIVIELKVTEFEPEYIGKLNFYLSAIDTLIKTDDDKPTIGILLCKNKNNVVVDFALKDTNIPMGVSDFTYTELPVDLKNALPTTEQFTEQLNNMD